MSPRRWHKAQYISLVDPRTEWRGAQAFLPALLTGTTTDVIIGSATDINSMTQPTAKTIRGQMFAQVVNNATNAGGIYFIGIIVVPGGFAGAPQPQDNPELSWMWVRYGQVQVGATFDNGARTIERWDMHVKSMRRLNEGDSIHMYIHNDGPGSIDVGYSLRVLYGEGK